MTCRQWLYDRWRFRNQPGQLLQPTATGRLISVELGLTFFSETL